MSIAWVFAIAALLLSAIGVYVLFGHMVVQRRNESACEWRWAQLREAVTAAAAARLGARDFRFGRGVGRRWWVGGLLSKQPYENAPTDLATFGISLLLLIAVATLACWIPSRKAARIDRVLALRLD